MELFIVNRYNGEVPENLNEDEQKNLKNVLKKIEKRRKQRQVEKERTKKDKPSRQLRRILKKSLYKLNTPKVNIDSTVLNKIKESTVLNMIKESVVLNPPEESMVLKPPEIQEDSTRVTIKRNEDDEASTKEKEDDEASIKVKEEIDDEAFTNEQQEEEVKPPINGEEMKQVNVEGFTILGTDDFAKKRKAVRVLPKWLRKPSLVSMDLAQSVKLSYVKELTVESQTRLEQNNIKTLFPIQADFIPWQMAASKYSDLLIPRDVCVSAPTGSGKTLAFTVPVVQYLTRKLAERSITSKLIRVLVVLPTQSLAQQIFKTFKSYCVATRLEVGIVTGEKSFQDEQKQLITNNSVWGSVSRVDILVCTAGRLVDHIKLTNGFDLRNLEYLIIDEADRVLDTVQDDWLYHLQVHMRDVQHSVNILNLLSSKSRKGRPQKLLFSATLSQDPEKLQKLSLFQPKLFTCVADNKDKCMLANDSKFLGKYTTPIELTEKYAVCTPDLKPLVIYKLINDCVITTGKSPRILVFTNSANNAHRLKILLAAMSENHLNVGEISSSNTSLQERSALMASFLNGDVNILICTDSMTRGIDLPNVDCVISYNAPAHLKTYIHRAGRTARAGCLGLAITMVNPEQKDWFLKLLKPAAKDNLAQIQIENDDLEPLIVLYKKSLEELKLQVTNEANKNREMIKKRKNPNAATSKRQKRKMAKKGIVNT